MQIRQCFGTQLGCHRREQEEFSRYASVDILFDERQTLLGNIDVIPPWPQPWQHLLSGTQPDRTTLPVHRRHPLPQRGRQLESRLYSRPQHPEDRQTMATSIAGLRDLQPDVVVGSAFAGSSGYQEMRRGEWKEHVDGALERLLG